MGTRLPRGVLLAFDGIDGAGKTTQTALLGDALESHGFDVVRSKEPTNGKWGLRLRESARTGRLAPPDELAAFLEDRRDHIHSLIGPALHDGKIVILDRYYFSTVAYQGARGMDPAFLLEVNEEFAPAPDALFLLRIAPRVGLERVAARGDTANHFEREDNLTICARIFDSIDRPFVRRVDASRDIKSIADEILWGVCEGPIADRLYRSADGPSIRADYTRMFLEETKRIARDGSIEPGDKPAAVLQLLARIPT
jgi:dTMP kinase